VRMQPARRQRTSVALLPLLPLLLLPRLTLLPAFGAMPRALSSLGFMFLYLFRVWAELRVKPPL
jgi:hypothetical protein